MSWRKFNNLSIKVYCFSSYGS